MKMHFGHKIFLTFTAFAVLMGVLVYKSFQTDFELVSKNYYQEELEYQKVIDANQNREALQSPVRIEINGDQLQVVLPAEMNNKALSGAIFFYCPSNSKQDQSFPIQASTTDIPLKALAKGGYVVKTSWTAEGKSFHQEQNWVVK